MFLTWTDLGFRVRVRNFCRISRTLELRRVYKTLGFVKTVLHAAVSSVVSCFMTLVESFSENFPGEASFVNTLTAERNLCIFQAR